MGCSNQKLHSQQIAYQRDFLGACWNTSLGDEEAEEYLASRWMGVSKNVMALYTNNHCFTVRTLNKDEKARTDAAASGKPGLKPADDPTGLVRGFGGNLGGGGGGVQSPSTSPVFGDTQSNSFLGQTPTSTSNAVSTYAPFPEGKQGTDFFTTPSLKAKVPPLPASMSSKPSSRLTTAMPTHTTVRQSTSHNHTFNSNSVVSAATPGERDGGLANNPSMMTRSPLPLVPEKLRKGSDPAALRKVVKDSIESERVVHADHPYLQHHGLSVYSGVVFRCAPAHRLYHRISLVPEANMKRLYDMQVTAMSRSVLLDAPSLMLPQPVGGLGGNGRNEVYYHFQPGDSNSDYPRLQQSSDREERGVPPMTPQVTPGSPLSMVPSPMARPLGRPPTTATAASMERSINEGNVPLLEPSLDRASLPSLSLGAVPTRHLRFASGPGPQQNTVINDWAGESPLSTLNNYPAEDRDVSGITATGPPVIIGSVTANELQALPPNAEICFGGWLYVSLQDEQERLRRSLKRYAARQRRRAAKAAAEGPVWFSSASSAPRNRHGAQQRRNTTNTVTGEGFNCTFVADLTNIEVEGSTESRNDTSVNNDTSPFAKSVSPQKRGGGVGGEERTPATGTLVNATSRTAAYRKSEGSPRPEAVDSDASEGGKVLHDNNKSTDPNNDDAPDDTTTLARSPSICRVPVAKSVAENTCNFTGVSESATSALPNGTDKTNSDSNNNDNRISAAGAAAPPLTLTPLWERTDVEPLGTATGLRGSQSVTVASLRTPSRLRPRSSSVPSSPKLGPPNNNISVMPQISPPLRHTGRYAREAMEADALSAAWLPYAYIVVAVPMYECSLVPTTFHTAFTRHKAVSLNLGSAQSRQAYGVGCITGVRYGGVMIIEYRDKINDEEDAEWIAELIQVGKIARRRRGECGTSRNDDGEDDDDDGLPNLDLSASALFRRHHSATHHARAEKLRRIKSRIWHKLRRQGLHVVLAATRMADRRHRQQRASIASEVNDLFSNSYVGAAAAVMGASHTPQHFAAHVRRTTSAMPNLPSSNANVDTQRSKLVAPRLERNEPVRDENTGVEEGGVGADYGAGEAEELSEAMEDFDSADSSISSDSDDNSSSPSSRNSSLDSDRRYGGAGAENVHNSSGARSRQGGRSSSGKRRKGQWWRPSSSRRRHHRRHESRCGENELVAATTTRGGKGGKGHRHRGHHRHYHRHGVTTREDRLRWADPQMADDFYMRGTFRQIGGMKYLDVVSLMDGCPVSELVQGVKRWVVNLLSMPIKARPICLFLQRYEGIAASLRIIQTQLTATALASNVASGKQLAQGNFSFHMTSAGLPRADGSLGMDEVAASFTMQHVGEPVIDPVASPSALVNASFAALQAPVPPPTRTLAYHTYYCGPLEPVVRAVLPPEVEAIITSCQTRQLPDVLKSPASQAPVEVLSTANTANPLSSPVGALASSKLSTLISTTTMNTASAMDQVNTKKVQSTSSAAAAAATPQTFVHKKPSSDSAEVIPPNLGASSPLYGMPHCNDVSSQLSSQQHAGPATVNLSFLAPVVPNEVDAASAAVTHPQAKTAPTSRALSTVPLHGGFGGPGPAFKTTGTLETDVAGHIKPPANTVPKTITEFLFYDDPTKHDSTIGSSITAGNGQVLAAAAAALVLAENVKGPGTVAAASNASFAAQSTNNCSFATVHAPNDDSMLEVLHTVGGGSFDNAKGRKDSTVAVIHNNTSFISIEDCTSRADKKPLASPTATTTITAKPKEEQQQPEGDRNSKLEINATNKKEGMSDTSTGTSSRLEGAVREASKASGAPSLQLLQPARPRNGSDTASDDNKGADTDDGSDSDEAGERELEWQLADRELRALKSELDEVTHLALIARAELLERLKELIRLGAVFLPHTPPDQVGLCLITMKMLRQYPEEVPVKEIHTDWVPLLMTLLTSSREHLFCSLGYHGSDLGRTVGRAQGFLSAYDNIVDQSDMCDANKRWNACDAGITKYTIDPLPPMPAPRHLHDIVIAPQPVRLTKTMLHDMKRVGMDSEGLSFSFSGGSLGVLAGVLYYYSDFLRAKYRSEVAAAGGRAKDAGATVLDVLSHGGYNVLLRRIWIWGVTSESKKSDSQNAAVVTKKLLAKRLAFGDDTTSGNGGSTPPTSPLADEHDHVVTNTASIGGGYVRVVGHPFRGTEAYALYDAIVHYLRTLEDLCTEHQGNNSITPQAPVKRRSVLMAWRRNKDSNPTTATVTGASGVGSGIGAGGGADAQNSTADGLPEASVSARDLVPVFEVCVATNYYYKRLMDEAHWPARSHTGGAGLPHHASTADARGTLTTHDSSHAAFEVQQRGSQAFPIEKVHAPPTVAKRQSSTHKHDSGSNNSSHHESSVLEKPYCGGEEATKDALQRKATKKFYDFLADHYEQWRTRHSEDRATNAYGKRITVSMN